MCVAVHGMYRKTAGVVLSGVFVRSVASLSLERQKDLRARRADSRASVAYETIVVSAQRLGACEPAPSSTSLESGRWDGAGRALSGGAGCGRTHTRVASRAEGVKKALTRRKQTEFSAYRFRGSHASRRQKFKILECAGHDGNQ